MGDTNITGQGSTLLVAVCGWPGSGKTEAANALVAAMGAVLVDDAWPLRDLAMRHMGATREDVYTQAGKDAPLTIMGRRTTWREVLGDLGLAMEAALGEGVLPHMAVGQVSGPGTWVFPSCRRGQGHVYRRHGAMVLEVVRRGVSVPAREFDEYDGSAVTHRVDNSGTLEDLGDRVVGVVRGWVSGLAECPPPG